MMKKREKAGRTNGTVLDYLKKKCIQGFSRKQLLILDFLICFLFFKEEKMNTKYVFVTGGVVSGLGKGITAASLGRLLKNRGYKVTIQKFDPYINVDPGTMSPSEHGEVFVTNDGAETDLDLGHYERFYRRKFNKKLKCINGTDIFKCNRKRKKRVIFRQNNSSNSSYNK